VLLRKAHHSRLAQRLADTGSEKKRETLEEEERIKFSLIVAEWIQEAHFPVVLQILETANLAEIWKRLGGRRRAKTRHNRVRAWKVVHDGLLTSTGSPRPPFSFKRCRLLRLLQHGPLLQDQGLLLYRASHDQARRSSSCCSAGWLTAGGQHGRRCCSLYSSSSAWGVPAALGQYEETRDWQGATGATAWVLFQCPFGAVSSKPTRLMSDLARASEDPFQGWPFFDASAQYLGPLPHVCPHSGHKDQLIGKRKDGMGFKTSGSESYPAGMCRWLASMIVRSFFPLKRGLIVEAFSKVAAGSPASLGKNDIGRSSFRARFLPSV
jgi:hypothetical protein